MKSMRTIALFGLFILLIGYFVLTNSKWVGEEFRDMGESLQVRFLKPGHPFPGLLILNFDTQTDDHLPWGVFCARVLVGKVGYAPDEILYIPSLCGIVRDLKDSLKYEEKGAVSPALEQYYAHAYGAENILRGQISKTEDTLAFKGTIVNIKSNKTVANIEQNGLVSDPGDFFNQLSLKILSSLNIPLSMENKSYLSQKNTGNREAFQLALQGFAAPVEESETAFSLYQQATAKDPDFIYAYAGLSDRVPATDTTLAIAILKNAVTRFKQNTWLKVKYLIKLGDTNQLNEKIAVGRDILSRSPYCLEALVFYSHSYADADQYPKALTIMKKAVAYYPDCWSTYFNRGVIENAYALDARGGRYYSAMNFWERRIFNRNIDQGFLDMKKAHNLHPDCQLVLTTLIELCNEEGYPDTVMDKLFAQSTTLNPHYIDSYSPMIWHYRPGYSDQPEKLRELLAEGVRLNPDNLDFALQVFGNIEWYNRQGRAKSEQEIFLEDKDTLLAAKQIVARVVEKHPKDDSLTWRMAEMFYRMHDMKEAWIYYKKLPDPPNIAIFNLHEDYLHKSWTSNQLEDDKNAVKYADLCLASRPCNVCGPTALVVKADVMFTDNKVEDGFVLIKKAVDWNPEFPLALREYAYRAAHYETHIDQGMEYIQKEIKLDPGNARGYSILAQLYFVKKDKDNASDSIDKAIELDPSNDSYRQLKETIMDKL